MRIHTSPSIQITEIDKSQYSPAMTGTNLYIRGFTPKGEVYKPIDITSRTAFITIFGEPTTEAERYSFAAVCEALNQQGHVCFARLPYDNDSFEKMVGYKYYVSAMKGDSDKDSLSATSYKYIQEADSEINQYCEITTAKEPIFYDLATIDEYRTDEAKVGPNTFLIVDTTGATYGKITEDYRKGNRRELIGIVPIVTTAANALYAQSMIKFDNKLEISAYESISAKCLTTLSGLQISGDAGGGAISGLCESDLVKRINTNGYFYEQLCSFNTFSVQTNANGSDIADLGNTLGTWFDEWERIITNYHVEGYSKPTNLQQMLDFVNSMGKQYPESVTVAALSDATTSVLNDIIADTWFIIDPATGERTNNSIDGNKIAELSAAYIDAFIDNNTPYFGMTSSYINPTSIKFQLSNDADPTSYYYSATVVSVDALAEPIIRSVTDDDAIPETMCLDANNYFSTIQPAIDGVGFDPEHLKDIGVVVYKTYLDPSEGNKVSWEPVEAYCGSLYKDDKDPNTGVTKFIDTIINSQSQYINFFSNCFSSTAMKKKYLSELDILIAKPSNGAALGLYEKMTKKYISISKSIYDGFAKTEAKVTDINERDIDIVPDAGISNIASFLKAIYGDKGEYDLTITDDIGNSLLGMWKATDATSPAMKTWRTVVQKLDNFCKNVRKDCMFIADGPRPLVLQGQKKIIRESKPANTIDGNIIPYLKTVAGLNTSYGAGYLDWFEQADDYTGDFFWCPPSIKAMGVYINTDVNFNYWDAPAGLNRGVIPATDVAFSPTAFQADLIYDKCWNYAIRYPNDGIVLEGQKTLQTKPTALDRINVRRLLLRLERAVYKASRWFLYEGNTAYTRQRYVDAITPYFKECKIGGGCYDYKIVCDETVNTPDTIDRNELHCKIGIKPVKAIEYIMIDFIVARTGAAWAEVGL